MSGEIRDITEKNKGKPTCPPAVVDFLSQKDVLIPVLKQFCVILR
jgi:hypothetical protein